MKLWGRSQGAAPKVETALVGQMNSKVASKAQTESPERLMENEGQIT